MIEILRVFGCSKSREALQVQRFPAFVFQGTRGILPGLKSTGKKTVEPRHIYPLFVEKILSFEMDTKNCRPGRPRQTAPRRSNAVQLPIDSTRERLAVLQQDVP